MFLYQQLRARSLFSKERYIRDNKPKFLYKLIFLKTIMLPIKKAIMKHTMVRRENHGTGCPKEAARRHRLEWVSGSAYKAIFSPVGTRFTEKKVPPRKVIGSNMKLLKVAMSSWVLARRAARTPRKAKVKQVKRRLTRKDRPICSFGAISRATIRNAIELANPLTAPIKAFPNRSDSELIGPWDIHRSSWRKAGQYSA
jgi:hypothetical protein